MPRHPDGTMTAAQALTGITELYAVAGAIRLQLIALIDAERERAGGTGAVAGEPRP